jgi:hypothetical protein
VPPVTPDGCAALGVEACEVRRNYELEIRRDTNLVLESPACAVSILARRAREETIASREQR